MEFTCAALRRIIRSINVEIARFASTYMYYVYTLKYKYASFWKGGPSGDERPDHYSHMHTTQVTLPRALALWRPRGRDPRAAIWQRECFRCADVDSTYDCPSQYTVLCYSTWQQRLHIHCYYATVRDSRDSISMVWLPNVQVQKSAENSYITNYSY